MFINYVMECKMKKRAYIFFVFIMMFLLSSLAWGQDATVPKIIFKEKSFNAGEVVEGTLIEHTYTLYNRGNGLLKIQKVRPG